MYHRRTPGKEYNGILAVDLSEGNFRNPSLSGELQASRFPRLPWLKTPRQNLTSQTIKKNAAFIQFSITFLQRGQSPKLFIQNFATRTTAAPPHPQQNGNIAQIAAAAWLGLAKPKAWRDKPLMVNSVMPTNRSTIPV